MDDRPLHDSPAETFWERDWNEQEKRKIQMGYKQRASSKEPLSRVLASTHPQQKEIHPASLFSLSSAMMVNSTEAPSTSPTYVGFNGCSEIEFILPPSPFASSQ
ncbi:hypothetical protein BLNAU_14663 [Blattamonas nauphoetae]|uniref:Uncharacterized protein n=1 Tax=Blattamonas nauphoetae TaxID=2049346 RepID=A0ABQ9XD44_9EUKA|nr:hypothetical protein BLNAU_14663 [Blattamonas nauphoetae]